MKKTVIIVQARMRSTRLPGKILLEVLQKPLLQYQLERLERVRLKDQIIVATPDTPSEIPIWDLCEKLTVQTFKGSESDVLSRYYGAAIQCSAETIIRVTSDCPLIDPETVDLVISKFNSGGFDYASNTIDRTYPRGLDVEVFSMDALHIAHKESTKEFEREHVTPFFYNQPDRFLLGSVKHSNDLSKMRWTVDTQEDFELIQRMIISLHNKISFTFKDCLELLEKHPDWKKINSNVEQKKN